MGSSNTSFEEILEDKKNSRQTRSKSVSPQDPGLMLDKGIFSVGIDKASEIGTIKEEDEIEHGTGFSNNTA